MSSPSMFSSTVNIVRITFPEISLSTRDAHKLRGYFGNVFRDRSPLLHNHYESGEFRRKYPLVQYKVIGTVPTLVAIDEGAVLMTELFLKMREIDIDGKVYPIFNKNIQASREELGVKDDLFKYQFNTLWMALNQINHQAYRKADIEEQKRILKGILTGNILSFFKNMNLFLPDGVRILCFPQVEQNFTKFKEQKMIGFSGSFTTNAMIPNLVGLGKSVSRGFGTVSISN